MSRDDKGGCSVTPIEQKLARRIHEQRARLRQLEKMANGTRASDERWRRWMDIALRLGREVKEMKTGKPQS